MITTESLGVMIMPKLNRYMSPVFELVKEQYNNLREGDDYDYSPDIQAELFEKVEFCINQMISEREFYKEQKLEILKIGLDKRFDLRTLPNITELDQNRNNILLYVCALPDIKLLKFIVETCKANFPASMLRDFINKGGRYHSPLTIAACYGLNDVVTYLLENKGLINKANKFGRTPFICASEKGNLETVKLLHECGATLRLSDNAGRNAVIHAVRNGHEDVLIYLLDLGLSVESIDKTGNSALLHAAACGELEICQRLISWGANLKVVSANGCALLDAARQSESPEVIEYLESEYEKHFPSKKKKSKKKSSGRPSFAFLKEKEVQRPFL